MAVVHTYLFIQLNTQKGVEAEVTFILTVQNKWWVLPKGRNGLRHFLRVSHFGYTYLG